MRRHETTERTCDLCSSRPHLCYASCMQRRLNKPLRAVPAGLILIHRFPLPLLSFHNHRSLPVSIHGYHLQTLLTLPWLPCTPPSSPSPPVSLLPRPTFLPPSLPTPPVYAYNTPIQQLYRPVLHYIPLYRLCYPRLLTRPTPMT